MNKLYRTFLSLAFILGICLGSFLTYSSGQDTNDFPEFFEGKQNNESNTTPPKNATSAVLDFFQKQESKPDDIQETEINLKPGKTLHTKEMVEMPASSPKTQIDASDFEDPFYRVRGFQENSEKVLQPGTTLDGVQFQTYGDTNKFIEKFYKEANFSLKDVYGKIEYLERRGGCYTCHQGIERISNNHRFSCVRCHGGNRRSSSLPNAHKGLVSNPSSAKNAPRFCGKCHGDHVRRMERSLMSTAKRMVNITRFGWGAQTEDEIPFSLQPDDDEQALPTAAAGHPVDGFLRAKCLRCHIGSESPHRPGDYRASGCSSCHMIYSNDGISLSHDRAIQKLQNKNGKQNRFARKYSENSLNNPRGYPLLHKFTIAVPSLQCEHCHNNNGVGQEFEGLFAKPSRPKETLERINAEKPVLYGKEHEFLVPDIHREKGMHCIDCHIADEMKPEAEPGKLHSGVQIRCVDCHGTQEKLPEQYLLIESDPNTQKMIASINLNPNLKKTIRAGDTVLVNSSGSPMLHVKRVKKKWILTSKVSGKKHNIPLIKNLKPSIAHQIPKHMQEMECATCHARWAATEWGMHVIREGNFNPEKWKNWNFSDPSLQNLLSNASIKRKGMLDWPTAKSLPKKIEANILDEYWWTVFSDAGWSDMVMGKNSRGKYAILKPHYQYFITDPAGPSGLPSKRAEPPLTLDDSPGLIWTAYSPHTIRKTVRSCESCHQNSLSVGLGDTLRKSIQDAGKFLSGLKQNKQVNPEFQLKQGIDPNGMALQTHFPGDKSRFLNSEEITALQETSNRYRAFRSLNLRELNFSRLLNRKEFPYDVRHRLRENNMGQSQPREDLFYNVEKNQYVKIEKPKKAQKLPEEFTSELRKESEGNSKTIKPSKEEEGIIEFLNDIIQKKDEPQASEPLPLAGDATPL